jgi:hypothetical protein
MLQAFLLYTLESASREENVLSADSLQNLCRFVGVFDLAPPLTLICLFSGFSPKHAKKR